MLDSEGFPKLDMSQFHRYINILEVEMEINKKRTLETINHSNENFVDIELQSSLDKLTANKEPELLFNEMINLSVDSLEN